MEEARVAKHGVPEPEDTEEAAGSGVADEGGAVAAAAPDPDPGLAAAAAAGLADGGAPAAAPAEPEPARRGRPRRRALWLGAGAAAALALGAATWALWPTSDVHSVTVLGVDYSTNLEIEEHDGYTYVTVPVNTEAGSAVLEVPDADDTRAIREFLAGLDTLVPGEHVLTLRTANLHIIVDGMAE
ncbi:hypothetical protein [Leucobacter sp. PH1c]|uniref:hypothetical protein n=1 Tax=Leucobacter sp. PH1c TaxID=1397278 RepID=UPI00046951E3|nr:hypothetical protein [Leucobacter sp. PH1c]